MLCRLMFRWLSAPAIALALLAATVAVPAEASQLTAAVAFAPSSSSPASPANPSFQAPSPTAIQPPSAPVVPAAASGAVANSITVTPENAEETGDALMVHQRYQAALAAYRLVPKATADVWNKMGIAHQLMFNWEEASHCYQASLRLEPRNARVLNNLGTIYDSQKEYSSAEHLYHRAIKLDPHSALIYKNLGTNQLVQRKYKKGWESYKAALAIDPHIFQNSVSPRIENPSSVQQRGAMNYFMAKGCVRAGMNECAIDYLRMALNEGFTSPKKVEADMEFSALRGTPAFVQLLAEQTKQ